MSNKILYTTIIISLFIHLGIINIFSNISNSWSNQEKIEYFNISNKIVFLTQNSLSHSVDEKSVKSSLNNQEVFKEDLVTKNDVVIKKENIKVKNIIEEESKNISSNPYETEEIIQNQDSKLESLGQKTTKDIEYTGNFLEKEENNINKGSKVKPVIIERETEEKSSKYAEIITSSDKKKVNNSLADWGETISSEPLDLTKSDLLEKKIIPPKIVFLNQPVYPEKLRRREIEGKVNLKILIDKKGKVAKVEIQDSSG